MKTRLEVIGCVLGIALAASESHGDVYFEDDFTGNALDSSKWSASTNGYPPPAISLSNGFVQMGQPGMGSLDFPYVINAGNTLFPASHAFSLEFAVQYTGRAVNGDGFFVVGPNNETVLEVWAGSSSGLQVFLLGVSSVSLGDQLNLHTYRLDVVGTTGTVLVDGAVVLSGPLAARPTKLWFGHPTVGEVCGTNCPGNAGGQVTGRWWSYAAWTTFKVDYIRVRRDCEASFVRDASYGSLLFAPFCTTDASGLAQDVYNSTTLGLLRATNDRFFLSSQGTQFAPVVVDDAVHINGADAGLGPYAYQSGVPPFLYDVPIQQNLQPLDALDVTTKISFGNSTALFELLDTQRAIYGNTAVYVVQDCGIWLSGNQPTAINFVTHADQVAGFHSHFDVRYGLLSELRSDGNFSHASCLGQFFDTPGSTTLPNPPGGDGYYYLARGLSSCVAQGYGTSTLAPDPRVTLNAQPTCP